MSLDVFRVYLDVGRDGYPPEWHAEIKHAVREQAGHRCVRCGHPYVKGAGEWSPCDLQCKHGGPLRVLTTDGWRDFSPGTAASVPALRSDYPGVPIEAAWRILTVHHLNGDKADCRWWNLASLCQRCHLRVQRVVVMGRVYPWEHSDWFKPYAAGWYAHAYLGEDLTREQVAERLDELLALERAA